MVLKVADSAAQLNSMLDGQGFGDCWQTFELEADSKRKRRLCNQLLVSTTWCMPPRTWSELLTNFLSVWESRPRLGCRHPQWGTRNALLSLGSRCYLEVIGPDPTSPRNGPPRPFDIDRLRQARLATWACKSNDIQKMVQIGKAVGISLGIVQQGQRAKPDGTILTWSLTDLEADREGGIVPFFIDWGYSPSSGTGCAAWLHVERA